MKIAIKFAVIGVSFIVAGLVLNHLAIWNYEQLILLDPSDPPHPWPVMAGSVFLTLIPLGLIFLAYSAFLMFREYRIEIRENKVGSG